MVEIMKSKILYLFIIVILTAASSPTQVLSQISSPTGKSPVGAFFRSLLLPGWGEHYAGRKGISIYLIAAEASCWTGYVSLHLYSNWLEEDYKTFGASHAGINPEDKSKQYFVDAGNFDDIYQYNDKKRFDRDTGMQYPENSAYFWKWDNSANRKRFEEIRIKSDKMDNRKIYFASAILFNHLVSAIEATILTRRKPDTESESANSSFFVFAEASSSKVLVSFCCNF